MPRMVDGGRPCPERLCPDKSECKEVDLCENSRAVHTSPHNSETVIDSEKSSVNVNRKSDIGFPTSHQPRSCITPSFPKMVLGCPNLSFFAKISTKIQVCYKVSFCLKTSSGEVVVQSTTYRTVSTFWQRMAPFLENLGLQAPTPNRKHVRF